MHPAAVWVQIWSMQPSPGSVQHNENPTRCLNEADQSDKMNPSHLAKPFDAGATAQIAAAFCGVNSKTSAYYFHRLWETVALEREAIGKPLFDGEIEVDENYFGGNCNGSF